MADNGTKFTITEQTTEDFSDCANQNVADEEIVRSEWLQAVACYVKQTQTNILDLKHKNLGFNEVKSILNFLRDSQVTELNLEGNRLTNSMTDLSPLLTKTKIKKLNVSDCGFTNEDMSKLLESLKYSQITDLDVSRNRDIKLKSDEILRCVACLKKSKLTTLTSQIFWHIDHEAICVFQDFLSTSITCVDLHYVELNSNDLIFLFTSLGHSLVTDLRLKVGTFPFSTEALQELSRRLVGMKVKKLDLAGNWLNDSQLNILVEGLVNFSVTDLNLEENSFSNVWSLFTRLKETHIRTLKLANIGVRYLGSFVSSDSLRYCALVSLSLRKFGLSDEDGERLMESLRFSSVTKLDISKNNVKLRTVKKFAENVNDINLGDLDISNNPLSRDALFILGNCLKQSKLTSIGVSHVRESGNFPWMEPADVLLFLKLTEESPIVHIEMNGYFLWFSSSLVCDSKILANTTFSDLHFSCKYFGENISSLLSYMRYSSITYLKASYSKVGDKDIATFVECLKETQIRRLNLNNNSVTSQGAKALAFSLKDTNLLYLHLNENCIEFDGLELLAEHAKDTFVSELDVLGQTASKDFERGLILIENVLWRNKLLVHRLCSIFKQIVPQPNNEKFCFELKCDDSTVNTFLEECMWFYKTIIDKPRAINVLLEKKCISLSREQFYTFVSQKFPEEFSDFIACRIEANAVTHISILKQAEEMGLTAVVENLLLHRPIYLLDEGQGILYPYVYKLLLKYKQLICNLDVEPCGLERIIEYFTQHAHAEDAQDTVNFLRDAKIL